MAKLRSFLLWSKYSPISRTMRQYYLNNSWWNMPSLRNFHWCKPRMTSNTQPTRNGTKTWVWLPPVHHPILDIRQSINGWPKHLLRFWWKQRYKFVLTILLHVSQQIWWLEATWLHGFCDHNRPMLRRVTPEARKRYPIQSSYGG